MLTPPGSRPAPTATSGSPTTAPIRSASPRLTTCATGGDAQPPASVTAGSGFGLTVQAEDSSGNPITSFNGTVTVALGTNPGGATLGGTLTATASNGVATFSGLTLNKAAAGYMLYASGGGYGWGVTKPHDRDPRRRLSARDDDRAAGHRQAERASSACKPRSRTRMATW